MARRCVGLRLNLRLRLLLITLTPALIGGALLSLYFLNRILDAAEESLLTRGRALARQLAVAVEYDYIMGNYATLQRLLHAASTQPDVLAAAIQRPDGRWSVVSGQSATLGTPPWRDGPYELAFGRWRVFAHPIGPALDEPLDPYLAGQPFTPVRANLVVALDHATVQRLRTRALIDAALLLAAILPLVAWLAWRVSQTLSRRLMAMSQAVERIAGGELSVRIEAGADGELGQLEHNINRMAAALQEGREGLERRIQEATAELSAQKQAAEAAVAAKSRFLAAASHDLRQPLHALTLLVAALKDRLSDPDNRQIVHHLEESALAMQELLNSLLDLSRLDAGVVEVRAQCFPAERLLQGLARRFAPVAADKGLELRVRSAPLWVYSDPVLVERILSNLMANAIRYTDSGWVAISARAERGLLRLEVWDTGSGIPREYQERIFEEYFQLANPERSRDKGLGLGLAIAARLARLLDTRITVDSEPGRGSRFSLQLPLCTPAGAAEDSDSSAPTAAEMDRPALIACIDDDPSVLEAMLTLLDSWGMEAAVGTDADQVLADLAQLGRRPDVIVTDYRLTAGATGLEAIARVRAALGADIPAVLVTGDTAPETIRTIDASGLPVLHKPIRPAKLRAVLSAQLQRARLSAEQAPAAAPADSIPRSPAGRHDP
ncbi:MAG: ATP-binding protein [Thiobacillaceae bacterium]|nr:ATP-binding protein [Thiobacillaceae bacterium]